MKPRGNKTSTLIVLCVSQYLARTCSDFKSHCVFAEFEKEVSHFAGSVVNTCVSVDGCNLNCFGYSNLKCIEPIERSPTTLSKRPTNKLKFKILCAIPQVRSATPRHSIGLPHSSFMARFTAICVEIIFCWRPQNPLNYRHNEGRIEKM